MKFQAEMALLLAMILGFHVVGALIFIPAAVSLLKPRFAMVLGERITREIAEGEADAQTLAARG
jgi:hypothetical protein